MNNQWLDTSSGFSLADPKIYVVQTNRIIVERCLLMATDPGDLVVDPTCGSGTTAIVCEQWARRWITVDTSRVALALARARIMGARFPYYYLADSTEGRLKDSEITGKVGSDFTTRGDIRQGFIYDRSPHISVGLMHLAKGLEFKAVAVMACDDNVLPLQSRIDSVADEVELDDVYELGHLERPRSCWQLASLRRRGGVLRKPTSLRAG